MSGKRSEWTSVPEMPPQLLQSFYAGQSGGDLSVSLCSFKLSGA